MNNKHTIAILGFGVVGGGVANLIENNKCEIKNFVNRDVVIKRILDLRDFEDSPFASLVTHDFNDILNDSDIDTVVETMGGAHPAHEFTVALLKAKKNVVTSNKEVVATYGDEFLKLAEENGVCYRFEASVGGGIPVLSPLISCLRHNKMKEIRGIVNGTTNYILTQMFEYGETFENSLKDAQNKGYAEKNPDADILGIDTSRKITILNALMTDKLVDVSLVPTEGITGIRKEDVDASALLNKKIRLLGRCIMRNDGKSFVLVAPFLIPKESPLASVNGAFNAVEVVGEPVGDVMFYGKGAGADSTSSAVVSDIMQIVCGGRASSQPKMTKVDYSPKELFREFKCKNYIALPKLATNIAKETFDNAEFLNTENECAFITPEISEVELNNKLETIEETYHILSRIRCL